VAVKIDAKKCLKCGVCIEGCPEGAFVVVNKVTEKDGLNLYTIKVDKEKCNDCGVCLAYEWYCPAKAISKA
jgi:ferredoxin